MAGCIDLVQRCYTGLDTSGQVLHLNPRFPEHMRRLQMHIRYRGHWLDLDIAGNRIRIHSLACQALPVELEVCGERIQLEEGQTKEIEWK